MGNEYYHQSQQQPKSKSRGDPLLRELSALSRAPSLRDPSTSSVWKSGVQQPKAERERRRGSFPRTQAIAEDADEGESEEDEEEGKEADESLQTGWQNKVVNWIDGGLREGERKQELLRSISEILNAKMEPPPPAVERSSSLNARHRKTGSGESHTRTGAVRREHLHGRKKEPKARIAWREESPEQEHEQALALTRHPKFRNEADPGYDYEESDSSSGDETDGLVSHSHSPLLGMHGNNTSHNVKERRVRRHSRKVANGNTGCANFRFSLGHPSYKPLAKPGSDHADGTEASHGCGLPWPYWSRPKGKNWLEVAGRSLSCGYADIPRRKVTGQEIIPASFSGESPSPSAPYEHEGVGRKHRSLSQKYRPKTFREMVGQNMLVQALTNAVTRGRVAPVYLFHGPRGTGKTSAARILAAALNCLAVEDGRPCGVCRECLLLCLGKSSDVKEVDVASHDATLLMKKLQSDVAVPPASGRYKVFIIDECHTLTADGWNVFIKCLEEPPEYAVFILTTTDAEQLPHPAITRCQKFHFPKIKDSDVVTRLQKVAAKEGMEVEAEALELIAARSNGSLRDAETTLDQLGLVGQRITLQVVQELVGLVSNAKLADLLDMALSGDTLNTVKCIREFMDAGVEPLALMSQIATLITDILGGGYVPASDNKGFFHKHTLTKDQLDKLRKALKTLSESEKQIRSSQDQTTWLTAALLQFAPDSQSAFPLSSGGTSGTPSVLAANDTSEKETIEWEPPPTKQSWDDFEHHQLRSLSGHLHSLHLDVDNINSIHEYPAPDGERVALERQQKLADTWIRVLEVSQSSMLKQLLWNHSRLLSISIEAGRAVAYLEFQHPEHRSSAERSKTSISHAFQLVLGFPVEIRLRLAGEVKSGCDDKKSLSESKAPPSPAKSAQAEFLNSRSFPAFVGRAKGATDEFGDGDKASWEHAADEFRASVKSCSSENQSDHELKLSALHHAAGRQTIQTQGRRFKLKTVRNFSTDLTCEPAKQPAVPEVKNQKSGSRQKHGTSLLCWKANKVNEDDDEDSTHETAV